LRIAPGHTGVPDSPEGDAPEVDPARALGDLAAGDLDIGAAGHRRQPAAAKGGNVAEDPLEVRARALWSALVSQLRSTRLGHESLSQVRLAAKLGVAVNTLFRWESQREFPTAARLELWCCALGLSLTLVERPGVEAGRPGGALNGRTGGTLSGLVAALRQAREQRQITQAWLASALGLARSSIRRWEDGSTSPRPLALMKWAILLNCTLQLVPASD